MSRERIKLDLRVKRAISTGSVEQQSLYGQADTTTLQEAHRETEVSRALTNLMGTAVRSGIQHVQARTHSENKQSVELEAVHQANMRERTPVFDNYVKSALAQFEPQHIGKTPDEKRKLFQEDAVFQELLSNYSEREDERHNFSQKHLSEQHLKWTKGYVTEQTALAYGSFQEDAYERLKVIADEEGTTSSSLAQVLQKMAGTAKTFGKAPDEFYSSLTGHIKSLLASEDKANKMLSIDIFEGMRSLEKGAATEQYLALEGRVDDTQNALNLHFMRKADMLFKAHLDRMVADGQVEELREMHALMTQQGSVDLRTTEQWQQHLSDALSKRASGVRSDSVGDAWLHGKVSMDQLGTSSTALKEADIKLAESVRERLSRGELSSAELKQIFVNGFGVNRDTPFVNTSNIFFGGLDYTPTDTEGAVSGRYIQSAVNAAHLAAMTDEPTAKQTLGSERYEEYQALKMLTGNELKDEEQIKKAVTALRDAKNYIATNGKPTRTLTEREALVTALKKHPNFSKSEAREFVATNKGAVDMAMAASKGDIKQATRLLKSVVLDLAFPYDGKNIMNGKHLARELVSTYSADPEDVLDKIFEGLAKEYGVDVDDIEYTVDATDGRFFSVTGLGIMPVSVDMLKEADKYRDAWQTPQAVREEKQGKEKKEEGDKKEFVPKRHKGYTHFYTHHGYPKPKEPS
ncbi:hypothetical protein [Candidatus Enterovibrio escicola]|uniref:hypothetical protein n=1 Tax=Candidatus Enterovibrio escicola TaxID=1927127 RepID=UPI0012381415|nr:hypothetical protein [Candidatus Enterovibrio escacola]